MTVQRGVFLHVFPSLQFFLIGVAVSTKKIRGKCSVWVGNQGCFCGYKFHPTVRMGQVTERLEDHPMS